MQLHLILEAIFTLFCVIFLVRFLPHDLHPFKKVIFTIVLCGTLFTLLTYPILLYIMLRDFMDFSFFAIYIVIGLSYLPGFLIQDEEKRISKYIANIVVFNYLVTYIPLLLVKLNNTYPLDILIKRVAIQVLFLVITLVIFSLIKKSKRSKFISFVSVVSFSCIVGLVIWVVITSHNNVEVGAYESRKTSRIEMDDEMYLANEYNFTLNIAATEVLGFTYDDNYVYVYSGSRYKENDYVVSVIDRDSMDVVKNYNLPYSETERITVSKSFNIFEHMGDVYINYFDGIYRVSNDEIVKVSDMGVNKTSYFKYDNGMYLVYGEEDKNYEIYKLENGEFILHDTLDFGQDNLYSKIVTTMDYLLIKDLQQKTITIYPDNEFQLDGILIHHEVLFVSLEELVLSDISNSELLGDYSSMRRFKYYNVDKLGIVEDIESKEYLPGTLELANVEEKNVYYRIGEPRHYPDFYTENEFPRRSILKDDKVGYLKYSMIEVKDKLYTMHYYDITDNSLYVEVNEVCEVKYTVDLGTFGYLQTNSLILTVGSIMTIYSISRRKPDEKPKEIPHVPSDFELFDLQVENTSDITDENK